MAQLCDQTVRASFGVADFGVVDFATRLVGDKERGTKPHLLGLNKVIHVPMADMQHLMRLNPERFELLAGLFIQSGGGLSNSAVVCEFDAVCRKYLPQ